jgi:hypothetical protein
MHLMPPSCAGARLSSSLSDGRRVRMKIALGVLIGLGIGYLAMFYFKSGHLPF